MIRTSMCSFYLYVYDVLIFQQYKSMLEFHMIILKEHSWQWHNDFLVRFVHVYFDMFAVALHGLVFLRHRNPPEVGVPVCFHLIPIPQYFYNSQWHLKFLCQLFSFIKCFILHLIVCIIQLNTNIFKTKRKLCSNCFVLFISQQVCICHLSSFNWRSSLKITAEFVPSTFSWIRKLPLIFFLGLRSSTRCFSVNSRMLNG